MKFVINNLLYDTDKMEKIADCAKIQMKIEPKKKDFELGFCSFFSVFEYESTVKCAIFKSKKNNYLAVVLDSDGSLTDLGSAISEEEAKKAIIDCDPIKYLEVWSDIEEA